MSYIDLQSTLRDWPYDPEKISVRKILGADGIVRLQMRVELGIIQMEAEGRPDGLHPYGCDSLLAYHQKRLEKYQYRNGTTLGYALSPQDCYSLRLEAALYYRRYVSYFVLEEFDNLIHDTANSLAIIDVCKEYAMELEDRGALEEFRSYVLMMHTRGLAYKAMEEKEPASALAHVNRGILEINSLYEVEGKPDLMEQSEELKILRDLAKQLSEKMPEDSILATRKALREAIDQEHFEEAARLRDKLNQFSEPANQPHCR